MCPWTSLIPPLAIRVAPPGRVTLSWSLTSYCVLTTDSIEFKRKHFSKFPGKTHYLGLGCSKLKAAHPRGVLQNNLYGDAQSRVQNFDHLYTSKSVILWPISIPFFCKKHPIWDKLGAFLAWFSKIHPILQIGRIVYVTITHPSIYQNSRKCTSKPLSIPVYHLSVRTSPPWVPTQLIIFLDFGAKILRIAHPVNYSYLAPCTAVYWCQCK